MTFAAMFHHFFDEVHSRGQGAINADEFNRIIDFLSRNFNLLDAEEFASRVVSGTASELDTCLTFDDALKCQIDVAVPVLREKGIQAFFFIYSSAFTDAPDDLEFYRDFRTVRFPRVDDFYAAFFATFRRFDPAAFAAYESGFPTDYLTEFPFYTEMDRRFRYARDQVLGPDNYNKVMDSMLDEHGYSRAERAPALFMSRDDVRRLSDAGHVAGLHSHSHPTMIDRLDPPRQRWEYDQNLEMIRDLTGKDVWAMSHPCGRYNADTLRILADMNMKIGFRSSMSVPEIRSPLEVPREDHANLLKRIA